MLLIKRTSPAIKYKYQNLLIPLLLLLFVSFFYFLTLAPTVLWGDDAFFQSAAVTGTLPPNGSNHWVWLQLAHLFTRFPVNNMAFRVNLLSAVAAVGTVGVMYGVARNLKLSQGAAVATAVSLTMAHTFWTHAVRAEVYTVFTFLMAVQLWLWFRWQPNQPFFLYAAFLLLGLTFLGHQMGVLLLPALAMLIWKRRRWLDGLKWIKLLLSLGLGMLPFLYVMVLDIGSRTGGVLTKSVYLYFTQAGSNYTSSFLDFSPNYLVRDFGLWLGFLGLQFIGLALIAGLIGIVSIWRKGAPAPNWLCVTILYVTTTLFAISYRVNDHYVFFLPSYLAFVLFIGAGWKHVEAFFGKRWPRLRWLLYLLLIAFPLLVYFSLPKTLIALNMNPLGVRQLPEREPNMFFLWPAKNGYRGAEIYGRNALESLPENAILLGEHTPVEPLKYLQNVEGVRPDVTIIRIPVKKDLALIVREFGLDTEIYLADNNPDYYNFSNLSEAKLEPFGSIYKLVE